MEKKRKMGKVDAKIAATSEISARIIRADGTIVDLGVIARSKKKNKFIEWLKNFIGGNTNG